MPDVAVIFGGPSPEHDVSILTGLQACRGLAQDGATPEVRALFWSKTGDWFEVDPTLEAEAFMDGLPGGAKPLQFSVTAGGGFSGEAGRLGRNRPLVIDAALVCCHGGPGEDGTLQAALDLAGIPYAGPTVAGAALGMDKLGFGAVMAANGLPTLPRVQVTSEGAPAGLSGPLHREAALRRVVDRHRRRRGLGHRPCPSAGQHPPAVRSGGRALPARSLRPAAGRPQLAVGGAFGHRTTPSNRGGRPTFSTTATSTWPAKAWPAPSASCRLDCPMRWRRSCDRPHRPSCDLAGVRGMARIDFLSDGRDLFVNEINTIPGSLARYLWVDPPVPFSVLLADLLDEAVHRPTHAYSAAGADGSVLRSAGSIAGKLA